MARSPQRIAFPAFLLVLAAYGSLAKPVEVLKQEAAPQATGLLLPTGAPPGGAGLGLVSLPTAATDPRSFKPLPVAGFPTLSAAQPVTPTAAQPAAAAAAAFPGAVPGALPTFPAQPGFPAAGGLPPLTPGYPAAAATAPGLMMPAAPMPTLPVAPYPTSLPGDGVMGHGGPLAIPGVTPAGSASTKEMVGGSNFDSVFGSSVSSLGMGSSLGDPLSGTSSLGMAGSGTLGGSGILGGAGTLGGNDGMASALRQRRAQNSAHSSQVSSAVVALVLLAAALVL